MTKRNADLVTGPPRGPGHYSDDGRRWWDDGQQHWLHLTDQEDQLEIEVEDLGGTSWLASLASTLFTQHGTAYRRFVARARSADPRWPTYAVVGSTFPTTPGSIDDLRSQGAWSEEITTSLDQLHERLVREGWRPCGRGDHWWSLRYTRPVIEQAGH